MKLYLAGPEVFLPDARDIGALKVALCARYGFEGLYPLDGELTLSGASDTPITSRAIFAKNVGLIKEAQGVIANLTPFRGISADPGTAFELGLAFALGKWVAGYSNLPGTLLARARGAIGAAAEGPPTLMADGRHAEDFGQFDNLMLAEALAHAGFPVIQAAQDAQDALDDPDRDLTLFERVLDALARARDCGTLNPHEPARSARGEERPHG